MAASEKFKKRLLALIKNSNLHKVQYASAVGVNNTTLFHATLYGIIPNVTSLIKIANYENISLDYLLGYTDDKTFYPALPPSTFQERFVSLAEENKTKFSEIARHMPCETALFYRWINRGNLPTVENLYILAEYFQVSADYLLGITDYKHN